MRRGPWGIVAAAALFVASGAAAEDNTVKIGVNAALTGSFVSAGNTIHNAVKLAVKQINDAGGFVVNGKTYKLEPYYRDDRTDASTHRWPRCAAGRVPWPDGSCAGACARSRC